MRLIILPISIFGAIGTPGQAFISELSRRVGPSRRHSYRKEGFISNRFLSNQASPAAFS